MGNVLRKLNLKQVLDALKRQVLVGRAYLDLARGLLGIDPVILSTAPTFFGLTSDGSLELSQMAIARLYDESGGTVTVPNMLALATQEIESFERGDREDVRQAIKNAEGTVAGLESVLASIKKRRDEWLAHLDQRTVNDPNALAAKAALTFPDLERAFKETEEIIITLSSLYEGTVGSLRFIGGDDYKTALDWIRLGKCAHIEKFENEYGAGSWTGLRPKDCSPLGQ